MLTMFLYADPGLVVFGCCGRVLRAVRDRALGGNSLIGPSLAGCRDIVGPVCVGMLLHGEMHLFPCIAVSLLSTRCHISFSTIFTIARRRDNDDMRTIWHFAGTITGADRRDVPEGTQADTNWNRALRLDTAAPDTDR